MRSLRLGVQARHILNLLARGDDTGLSEKPSTDVIAMLRAKVLYNTALRSKRRETIDKLLYSPEEIKPECLERLKR